MKSTENKNRRSRGTASNKPKPVTVSVNERDYRNQGCWESGIRRAVIQALPFLTERHLLAVAGLLQAINEHDGRDYNETTTPVENLLLDLLFGYNSAHNAEEHMSEIGVECYVKEFRVRFEELRQVAQQFATKYPYVVPKKVGEEPAYSNFRTKSKPEPPAETVQ